MNEKEIFFAALEKGSPEERLAFLDGACGKYPALRHKVDQLLEEHFAADSLLQQVAVDRDVTWEDAVKMSEGPGDIIGRYKLLQKIGEGGFGVVYMAEQKTPVKRRVALKIIKLGMDTKQVVGRFEAERQALAMMDHLNIAKVFDAGATDTGRPYFVMELVKGIPITQYCDENHLTTEERLQLFIPVCQAIQHAHQKGIIHRDIKPSNIMVTLHDGEPVCKVIDFGIAKATQQELTEKTVFTQYSQFIGTPAYMSPEQAEMSGLDIDTRSDVYSLGVLLYELLTGKTPLDGKELLSGGYEEIKRRIREVEPPNPSTRVGTLGRAERTQIAKYRKVEPGKLSGKIQGDLDLIVMKALEKDRTRRYETTNGLAADVRRFLRDEPVTAVAPTFGYQVLKFYQRNRQFVQATASVLVLIVIAAFFSTWQAYRANLAKEEATKQRDRAESLRAGAEAARLLAVEAQEEAAQSEADALEFADAERRRAYAADMNMVQRHLEQNNLGQARELLGRHIPKEGENDIRGWEWRYLWSITRGDHKKNLVRLPHILTRVAISPTGEWMALTGMDRRVSLWNLEREEHERDLSTAWGGVASGMTFSPDGRLLAYCDAKNDLVVSGLEGGLERARLPLGDVAIRWFGFSPSGDELLICTSSESGARLTWWQWPSSTLQDEWRGLPLTFGSSELGSRLAVDWDRKVLVTAGRSPEYGGRRVLVRLDWEEKKIRWGTANFDGPILSVAICEERNAVFAGLGMSKGDILELDFETGDLRQSLRGHTSWVARLELVDQGRKLLSCSADQTIRVWDLSETVPSTERVLRGHDWEVRDLAVHPNERDFITVSKDGTAKLWSMDDSDTRARLDLSFGESAEGRPVGVKWWRFGPSNEIYSMDLAMPKSKMWKLTGQNFSRRERLTFPEAGWEAAMPLGERGRVLVTARLPDGRRLIRDLVSGELIREIGPGKIDGSFLFGSLSHFHVRLPDTKEVEVWDLSNATESRLRLKLPADHGRLLRLHDLGDGRSWGLVRPEGGNLRLEVFTNDGKRVSQVGLGGRFGWAYDFSPEGPHFVIAHSPGYLSQFSLDAKTGLASLTRRYAGAPLGYRESTFSKDGRRLVGTSSGPHSVNIWDMETGSPLITLPGSGLNNYHNRVAFSPDESLLGREVGGGKISIWRAPELQEIDAVIGQEDSRDLPLMVRPAGAEAME